MVVETLFLLTSIHPNDSHDYNEKNPGLIVSVGAPYTEYVTPYVTAGAYLDSYGELAKLAGVGCDFGKTWGVGLTIAHVNGSGMDDYIAVPIPSVFIRHDDFAVRFILSPDVVAFGISYTFKP